MMLKTLKSGFSPVNVEDVSPEVPDDTDDALLGSVDTPFGFALHVLDTLEDEGQLDIYTKTGRFATGSFMSDHLGQLLWEHGYRDVTPEQVWEMAADIRFGTLGMVPDDISGLTYADRVNQT